MRQKTHAFVFLGGLLERGRLDVLLGSYFLCKSSS